MEFFKDILQDLLKSKELDKDNDIHLLRIHGELRRAVKKQQLDDGDGMYQNPQIAEAEQREENNRSLLHQRRPHWVRADKAISGRSSA